MSARVTGVINTLNEEANLPYALRSLAPWVDDIVVVDMHSDDRTAEIARSFGARVFLHERTSAPDGARAFALEQATGDWVMLLDADELVPRPLAERLLRVARGAEWDAVAIPRQNFLLGAPLGHTGWGPGQDRQTRFFRRGAMLGSDRVHVVLRPAPGTRMLRLPEAPGEALVHFNYVNSAHFLEKLNRYTTVEAEQALEAGRRVGPGKALLQTGWEFVRRYVRAGGWRDGWRGLYLSLFMAFYRAATAAKLQELEAMGGAEAVKAGYRDVAERVLAGYGEPASVPEPHR